MIKFPTHLACYISLTKGSLFCDPVTGFPLDVILLNIAVSSMSVVCEEADAPLEDFLADLFIKWLRAGGNCNQNKASEDSPKTAAANANLATQPLLTTVAYSLALSSSSIQPINSVQLRFNLKRRQ